MAETPQRVQGTGLTAAPAEAKPEGMSDEDWANFQSRYRPQAGAAPQPGYTPPAPAPAGTPGAPGQSTIPGQAGAASTYSATPGVAPSATTTNQGTQDVVRNSYLERASAPLKDPRTQPGYQIQTDAFNAATERARRDASGDLAEGTAGSGQTGMQTSEQRLINERAGQARGNFSADLVRQDLQNQRDDTNKALESLRGMISDDQTRQLQDKLAAIDAQLKQQSLSSSTDLGNRELSLRDKLGTGGLNLDMIRTLLQNDQFNNNLGFNIGDREAYWNQVALDRVMGG